MKEPLHIRVFELKCDRRLLKYVIQELQNGYVITDMANFGREVTRDHLLCPRHCQEISSREHDV